MIEIKSLKKTVWYIWFLNFILNIVLLNFVFSNIAVLRTWNGPINYQYILAIFALLLIFLLAVNGYFVFMYKPPEKSDTIKKIPPKRSSPRHTKKTKTKKRRKKR